MNKQYISTKRGKQIDKAVEISEKLPSQIEAILNEIKILQESQIDKDLIPQKLSDLINDITDQTYNSKSESPQSGKAVAEAIAQLLGSAPENLDTLEELAKALNEDENFSATVLAEISKKVDKVDGKGLSSNDYTDEDKEKVANFDGNAGINTEELDKRIKYIKYEVDEDGNSTPVNFDEITDFGVYHILDCIDNTSGEGITTLLIVDSWYGGEKYQTKIESGKISHRIYDDIEGEWSKWEPLYASKEEVDNKVGFTDYATRDKAGVVKVVTESNSHGIRLSADNILQIACAEKTDIAQKANYARPIVPAYIEYAVEVCTNQDSEAELTEAQLRLPPSTQYLKSVMSDIDKRIKYIDTWNIKDMDGCGNWWDWNSGSEYYFKDIYEEGIYTILYSSDSVGDSYGILIVSSEEYYEDNDYGVNTYISIQTFIQNGVTITRTAIREYDENGPIDRWREWSDWESVYATRYQVNSKVDKTTISKTISKNTLTLYHNRETRLGELAELILSMPSTIDERYESYFTFTSGETPTSLNYSATPIRWSGDDVDYDGIFIPEANKIYEVAVKYLGDDAEGNPIISARVGVV